MDFNVRNSAVNGIVVEDVEVTQDRGHGPAGAVEEDADDVHQVGDDDVLLVA